MASERQIEANRRNSARSTGPKSEEGKARSRANATKHGMAGESTGVAEAADRAAFRERRRAWGEEFRPSGRGAEWALDRAVAASLRIERCERAMEKLVRSTATRAGLSWDQDREAEAAGLVAKLARDPALVARKLASTYQGAGLLIELWERLAACLDGGEDWDETESGVALDLLGLPANLRNGPTPIDGPKGAELREFRRSIVAREIARLEALQDGPLAKLDDLDRESAEEGDIALLGDQGRLILRYERDAWRRYRESIDELKAQATTPSPAPVARPPAPLPPTPTSPAPREPERLDLADPRNAAVVELLDGRDIDELEDDELDEIIATLETRISRRAAGGGDRDIAPPERTRFAGAGA